MSVRHESQGGVTTVLLDLPDGWWAGAAQALAIDLATRGTAPGVGRHGAAAA